MIEIVPDINAQRLRCPPPSESDFDLELQEVEVTLSAASTSDLEVDDALIRRNTGASVRYDAIATYVPRVGDLAAPKFVSANPAIATVASNGNVTTVGSGNVDIFCRAFQTIKKVTHSARTVTPITTDTFLNYLEETLGEHATSEGDAVIAGGGELNLFSVKNPQTSTYARNAGCWASSLDWTGVSPHNSAGGFQMGGTLVSPRHLIWANHFNILNGTTITFVNADNQVFARTITSSTDIQNSDIRVGVLNSDIDASIAFYSVLPADWRDYLPTVFFTLLPLVTTDQEQKALCRELTNVTSIGLIAHRRAPSPPRQALSENIVLGDSGQPMFMLINGEMVFMGTHYTNFGIAPIMTRITEINAAMTTLGGGYQLTQVDLSGFNNFAN